MAKVQSLDSGITTPPDDAVPDTDDDTRAGGKLRQAFAALKARSWHKAGEAATAAMTADDVRPNQGRQARMILGIVACNTNDGAGAGQAMIRALEGYPRMQATIREACRAARKAGD